ncbi:MAG: ATP-dependent RecD-like DNA helicase, partial [Clostridia bacterium]|nr:ATP-dependent RecD-like DNA helicase [Clostridia bacterium]
YRDEDSLFTVAQIGMDGGTTVTAVGPFPSASVGQAVKVSGSWVQHREYGKQLRVDHVETIAPSTLQGIEKYLGSGLIRGIGPSTARRLVKQFGHDTLQVIESQPDALMTVPGIGKVKAERIVKAVAEHKSVQKVMVFLQSYGVTPTYAVKVYKRYGEDSIDVVSRNPYRLADDIYGIGFKTADRIARELGIDRDSMSRVQAGIKYWLARASDEGHCYSDLKEFVEAVSAELEVARELVQQGLKVLEESGDVFIQNETAVYLAPFYHAEKGVARRLCELAEARMWALEELPESELDEAQRRAGLSLGVQQRNAVMRSFQSGVMVITGGPGTGKTTTLRLIIDLFERRKLRVYLAAPTGRAAKRLSEATGKPARTIHRLLEFGPGEQGWRFGRGVDSPLECDVLVVDEVSMVDILLMYNLLKAIRPGMKLVLVGDVDQLPSVGPGNVLRDVIDSGVVDTVVLDQVFRQAPGSMIVMNAHRINKGEMPEFRDANDFYFMYQEDPEKIVETVVAAVATRLPRYLKCDAMDDIQVLSPMRRTVTGVDNLNAVLRDALNPPRRAASEIRAGALLFRRGDKVMQVRNNYERRVWNGDMGRIARIDPEEGEVVVRFPEADGDRDVTYRQEDLDELTLSYCVSIHKSQGSEYPAVVIPLSTQHYVMLQRNLVYTAVTRAKRMVVLVGTKKALAIAVGRASILKRRTMLAERLQEAASRGISDRQHDA